MFTAGSKSSPPLADREARALERALRVLHRELRAFLAAMPADSQTASGLARRLNIERTTCQRAVFAAVQPFSGLEMVRQLPGVAGLKMLAEAAGQMDSAESRRAATGLHEAIAAYDDISRRVAGSRSRLMARIEAPGVTSPSPAANDPERQRAQLFEAAAGLTGRFSQTWLAAHIYEPTDRPDRLIQTRGHGLIGHVAREDAVPLTFHVFTAPPPGQAPPEDTGRFVPLVAAADDDGPAELLRAFSTRPAPVVRSRQPNEFLVQTVDANPDEPARPFDLVFGLVGQMVHPGAAPPYLEELWALINFPVRWMLLDVFLRRDLGRTCVPGLDVHLWRPDFASQVGERWQTRFSTAPKLQVLGFDIAQPTPAYARQPEFLAYLFQQRGLDPAEFVGYRCEVAYPMWRTGYRITFDFGEARGQA